MPIPFVVTHCYYPSSLWKNLPPPHARQERTQYCQTAQDTLYLMPWVEIRTAAQVIFKQLWGQMEDRGACPLCSNRLLLPIISSEESISCGIQNEREHNIAKQHKIPCISRPGLKLEQRPRLYSSNYEGEWKIGVPVPFVVTHSYYPLSLSKKTCFFWNPRREHNLVKSHIATRVSKNQKEVHTVFIQKDWGEKFYL